MATRSVTITQAPPVSSAQFQFAVVQPPPSPAVPADLTLLFQLLSAAEAPSWFLSRTSSVRPLADSSYAIAPGSSYVRADKTGGIVKGQFVGTVAPTLNGKFSGSLTYVAGACTTERIFTGVVGDFLQWTARPARRVRRGLRADAVDLRQVQHGEKVGSAAVIVLVRF